MAEKLYKGQVSISRPHGPQPPYISIEVVDELSGSQFIEIHVSLEHFSEVLTGLSHVDCEFEWRPALVGKKYEHKTESVKFSGGYQESDSRGEAQAARALKRFEVDGWKARVSDLFNHHCSNHDGTFNVLFTRHVEVE